MGKAVPHGAGQRRPRDRGRGDLEGLGERPRCGAPRCRGDLDHAAEQAFLRAATEQHRAVRPGKPERDAVAQRPVWLRCPRGQVLGQTGRHRSATGAPRAQHAARPAGRADRGAEIHQRLREVAGPPGRNQRGGERSELRLCRGQRVAHGTEACNDALDIAVDRGFSAVERDRGDRRRGVIADPGQPAQRLGFLGESAAVPLDYGTSAGMQVAGPRIVAEPLPELQDFVERGRGER